MTSFTTGLFIRTLALLTPLAPLACASTAPRFTAPDGWTTTHSGLAYITIAPGTQPTAQWGDTVTIHETTSRMDGFLVFSSWNSGGPLSFTLGADQVVDGMEELVNGMAVGETRQAVMPPAITQRQRYPEPQGDQPAPFTRHDTLRFLVHLVGVQKPEPQP